MTGTDTAVASTREARSELPDAHAALVTRLDRSAALARSAPAAAADSLVFIRVSALASAPEAAKALEEAIRLLRDGGSADSVLARVRRALEPRASVASGAAEWAGVVP
jgi:hypothetical protein